MGPRYLQQCRWIWLARLEPHQVFVYAASLDAYFLYCRLKKY